MMSLGHQTAKEWIVYLLKCSDNTFYCGVTNDLDKRIKCHNNGTGAKYTRGRTPVELIGFRDNLSKEEAARLEYTVKQMNKSEKLESFNA